MSCEILINVTPRETRSVLVENGVLQEVLIERADARGLVGNIYQGKVSRVLPGMQAAFIDIGLERTAFLHANDIVLNPQQDTQPTVSISQLLHEGQTILVQVLKEPIGTKGARLTTQLSISAHYLVYMPNADTGVGVSLKIEQSEERHRLKTVIEDYLAAHHLSGGYIVRTAAEGVIAEELLAELVFLQQIWQERVSQQGNLALGDMLYQDLPLALRTLREFFSPEVERIRIDSTETYEKAVHFSKQFLPDALPFIEHYRGGGPLFDLFQVEEEIKKALERKVLLKSGGYLIFDQTEAMTTVDVNTGGFVGHHNLEETIFKTNLEAATAIARQLRVRNLGGIIILDFIDMVEQAHRAKVLATLEKAMLKDKARHQISHVSELGLVEMTRKRNRESLEHILCQPCPSCAGKGYIKSIETICYDIFRDILREARQYEHHPFMVLASQKVIEHLQNESSDYIADLEAFIGQSIGLKVEQHYSQEQFNVVLL